MESTRAMRRTVTTTIVLLLAVGVTSALTGCQTTPVTTASPSPTTAPTAAPTETEPPTEQPASSTPTTDPKLVSEQPVTVIPLAEPLARRDAEVSGLAWHDDTLIILPQYPNFFTTGGGGFLFALPKADILAFLDGTVNGPLEPIQIPFVAPGLSEKIDGYQGYEAIAFAGDEAFLTIEAETNHPMGYLVTGTIAPDLSELTLDTSNLVEIQPQSASGNKSEEALVVTGDTIITIYEVNGVALNLSPVAHAFDASMAPVGTLSFPNIEYRVTDATALDGADRFWMINYFYPGDTDLLPETDPLAEKYGQGPTHATHAYVERLVEFQYAGAGITLVDTSPIQLALIEEDARNWEGVVRLDDRGFLLMTDRYPQTLLGFVAAP
ncbi:MAG: hypothetical protein SXV54_07490 [Chloroflexota bacterium]|nr:hypothetical protein [Chloroflexota bacterium]